MEWANASEVARAVANGEQGALAKVFDKAEGGSMVANQTVVAHQG